jgi:hypothetical protein
MKVVEAGRGLVVERAGSRSDEADMMMQIKIVYIV